MAYKVALHTHSNYSDGGLGVSELVTEMKMASVGFASLCDHDTIGGAGEFQASTKKAGIESIAGFELSTCYDNNYYIHILAYGFDMENSREIERTLRKNCHAHNVCFGETLVKINQTLGLHLTTEEIRFVTSRSGKANFTLPLFQYLTSYHKYDPIDIKHLFFSGDGSPIKRLLTSGNLMTLEEGMEFIVNIGATPVFAHPGLFTKYSLSGSATEKKLEKLFELMLDYGLKGAEYFYPYLDEPAIRFYAGVANRLIEKYGLWKLSGSDCHGPYKMNSCGIAMPGMSLAEALKFKAFCER